MPELILPLKNMSAQDVIWTTHKTPEELKKEY